MKSSVGIIFLLCIPMLCPLVGCFAPEKPSLTSDDPALKIPAMAKSGADKDEKAVGQLVKDLNNDDPAVRFYAITALKEITGNSFDYRYYEDDLERLPALKRWQEWLATRKAGATQPSATNSR